MAIVGCNGIRYEVHIILKNGKPIQAYSDKVKALIGIKDLVVQDPNNSYELMTFVTEDEVEV